MKTASISLIPIFAVITGVSACGGKTTEVQIPERPFAFQVEQPSANASGDPIISEPVAKVEVAPAPVVVNPVESIPVDAAVVVPVLNKISDQTTVLGVALLPVEFQFDSGSPAADAVLKFTAEVTDDTLLDPATVNIICKPIADKPGVCNGEINLTPKPGAFGKTVISISADNGQQIVSQSFSLSVTLGLTAADDSFLSSSNQPLVINIADDILANDKVLSPGVISLADIKPAAKGGTIIANGNGTITYVPAKDFVGLETILYTITDGQNGTSTAAMKISIDPLLDSFTRADSATVGFGWSETEVGGASTNIVNGALNFTCDNSLNSPIIVNKFPLQTTGKIEWTFDFGWTRNIENNWSFSMQLGKAGAGSAVNLVWGGGTADTLTFSDVNRLATISNSVMTERTTINGATAIKVIANLDNKTYELIVGGVSYAAIPFDSNVGIDSVTFKSNVLASINFDTQDIDNVRVRRLP